jgi:hypothetical protein
MKALYGFSDKRIEPVGVITLLVSFGILQNPRTEYIAFDVIDMHYSYNASVFVSQKDTKNIEQGFTLSHKNVHFLREESEQYQQSACPLKVEALT